MHFVCIELISFIVLKNITPMLAALSSASSEKNYIRTKDMDKLNVDTDSCSSSDVISHSQ